MATVRKSPRSLTARWSFRKLRVDSQGFREPAACETLFFLPMPSITAACNAMATRFEMVLHGEDAVALRAAAEAAVHEIERLHAQLSLYSPSSEISYINAHAD